MYEARWDNDGDTLRIWDCEKHVPVCGVYLSKNPKQRVELARVIARALNEHSVEQAARGERKASKSVGLVGPVFQ